jgi:prepilin-type N-terminal cleavage/methylation domain-containing protein
MQTQTFRLSSPRLNRRARGGFSLLEVLVVIAIIAMLSGAVAVAVIKHKEQADISMTRTNAQTIRLGVKSWWVTHDSATCPTVKTLVVDGELDKGKVAKDAWQQAWRLKCEDNDITVLSNGPDKLPDTEDDIRVPAADLG